MTIVSGKFVLGTIGVFLHSFPKSIFHILESRVRETDQGRSGQRHVERLAVTQKGGKWKRLSGRHCFFE